ncbi:hypothetical protein ACKWTF_015383 [Chironomus riparius]
MWIATKDRFLADKLQLDAVYKLEAITRKTKEQLIAACRSQLQLEIKNNKEIEFHRHFWTIIREHFESIDILDMIQEFGDVLALAVEFNIKEDVELTLSQII